MKGRTGIAVAIILGLQMVNFAALHAEDAKVPAKVSQEIADSQKQSPEKEKEEIGEASGNTKDCEPINESGAAKAGTREKDIDGCQVLVK